MARVLNNFIGKQNSLNYFTSKRRTPCVGYYGRPTLGFTLLELLVVVVIIGLLAGLVAPRYFESVGKSKTKVAKAQIESLDKALDQYRMDVGSYPGAELGLGALNSQPPNVANWQGPYLKKAVPVDPWGRNYIYVFKAGGSAVDIISYGADGKPGGTGEDQDVSLQPLN